MQADVLTGRTAAGPGHRPGQGAACVTMPSSPLPQPLLAPPSPFKTPLTPVLAQNSRAKRRRYLRHVSPSERAGAAGCAALEPGPTGGSGGRREGKGSGGTFLPAAPASCRASCPARPGPPALPPPCAAAGPGSARQPPGVPGEQPPPPARHGNRRQREGPPCGGGDRSGSARPGGAGAAMAEWGRGEAGEPPGERGMSPRSARCPQPGLGAAPGAAGRVAARCCRGF